MDPIYLDHASTTPVLPEVVEAMRPFWSATFGNPASAHRIGQRARQALETARETVAELLDADPNEVLFTSGATEANNLAIFGLAGEQPARIVTSPIEHPSVAEPVQQLAKRGFQIDVLRVDPEGQVPPAVNKELLSTKTRLMTMMLVNNETGMIQPVRELVDVARAEFFHCDAVQAVGKLRVRFHELGVSSMSVSAHKFHGPRGVGALLLRRGTRVSPQLYGGHQQAGLRPGTEPVALAVGMAKALELATQQLNDRRRHILMLRGRLLERLRSEVAPVHMHGNPDRSVPHIVNVALPGCPGDVLLMKLDLAGVACSTGSACSSGSLLPSPVLKAMGCSENILRSALRFSFSHSTTLSDIDQASDRIIAAVKDLRHLQLQPDEP